MVALLGLAVLILTGCASTAAPPSPVISHADDDFSELIAQLSNDLIRHRGRLEAALPATKTKAAAAKQRDTEFAERARALFAPLSGSALRMPVVGIRSSDLYDSWGNARDGGKRKHKGIDIFAPRNTPIVAVADGVISFIGDQPKGGHCIWLTTESGASFYYAHLERWAAGLFEGMEVRAGDLLGFVGNTGNAISTPPHLHFGINSNDEMVNPYPLLVRATPVQRARNTPEVGSASSR